MAKKTIKDFRNPGMFVTITYLNLLLVNVLVLWIAARWFPQYIVLGTLSLTTVWALWLSMGKLALINILIMPFFGGWKHCHNKRLCFIKKPSSCFLINFAGLWAITRFSDVFGLGVTSWKVVACLALVLSLVQSLTKAQLKKWCTN